MTIETAIMPVAGAGSRVFPCTTAIEKCMMPIYAGEQSRPVIDFMVEDCVLAGVKRIIFVTSERGKVQLSEYFEQINQNLKEQLVRLGRDDKLEEELARRESFNLTYEYIVQPSKQYGTAFPPFLAKDYLRGEARFALMGGDDFVYRQDGTSELAAAIETWNGSNANHVIMGKPISQADGPNYGILQTDSGGKLVQIDEKPPLERVPQEPVANISRYLLSDSIWPYIEAEMAKDRGSAEHFITYPINRAIADGQTFQVHPVGGEYMDGGSFEGLMRASQYISAHPSRLLNIDY
ncbi:MAG TPA: sugar phosphate nucleotidyltransferase [Candidatus Saccharimonadia bacterium]|nr:sugar phosphate nucleotidyltransferase [Candidatus Saccharimonadia bacterium]